jgi:hypothetical protein
MHRIHCSSTPSSLDGVLGLRRYGLKGQHDASNKKDVSRAMNEAVNEEAGETN